MKKIILGFVAITFLGLASCKKESTPEFQTDKSVQTTDLKTSKTNDVKLLAKASEETALKQKNFLNNFSAKTTNFEQKTGINSATLLASNAVMIGQPVGLVCSTSSNDIINVYVNVVTVESFHCNLNDMNFYSYFGSNLPNNAAEIVNISTDFSQNGIIVRTFNVRFDVPANIFHESSNIEDLTTVATSIYNVNPQYIFNTIDISTYGTYTVNPNPSSNPGTFGLNVNICYPDSQLQPNTNSTISFYDVLSPSNVITTTFITIFFTSGYPSGGGTFNYTITPHYSNGHIGFPYGGSFTVTP